MGSGAVTQTSWILELRQRLSTPPPLSLATEGARQTTLVPLLVDGGELWLLLAGPTGEELVPAAATLPGEPLAPQEDPWPAAERCSLRLGLDPSTVLRIGMLDQLPSPAGDVIVPCVAAVPPPPEVESPSRDAPPVVRLPLVAARTPSLLEERRAVVDAGPRRLAAGEPVETWVTVAHFGPVKLAGAEVEIVELLLDRLFHGG